MRSFSALLISFVLLLSLSTAIFASGFQLTQIGSLSTTGYQYAEWWYASANPALSGTTEPNATVEVAVDGTPQTVTADASGNWSASITAAEGDHSIILTSNASIYSFTLHISATMPEGMGAPTNPTQPVAGSIYPTLAILILGIASLGYGLKLAYSHSS